MAEAPVQTGDGLETALQVIHVAHAALVLRLRESSFAPGGRIVFFGTVVTEPGTSPMEKYPPVLPDDLGDLARIPQHVDAGDVIGTGLYGYATSKLAVTMIAYALNRRLEKVIKCISSH